MDSIIENTFENFKKITPTLVAVALLTGMLLFLPDGILGKMYLDNLPVLWSRIIGIAFLLSVALIGTIAISSAISYITSKIRNKRIQENMKKKLKILSPQQRSIILKVLRSKEKYENVKQNL